MLEMPFFKFFLADNTTSFSSFGRSGIIIGRIMQLVYEDILNQEKKEETISKVLSGKIIVYLC
jgi:hypothetical protein